jgi:transcriptional regulator with XRE-family HTH domain
MSAVASRLRLARELSGLSLAQVANILGTDAASIEITEEGARAAGPEEIVRLADVYEVDPSWLAGVGTEKVDLNDARFDLASADYAGLDPADVDMLRSALAAMRGTKKGA